MSRCLKKFRVFLKKWDCILPFRPSAMHYSERLKDWRTEHWRTGGLEDWRVGNPGIMMAWKNIQQPLDQQHHAGDKSWPSRISRRHINSQCIYFKVSCLLYLFIFDTLDSHKIYMHIWSFRIQDKNKNRLYCLSLYIIYTF